MQHAAGSMLHATCDMRQRVCQMQTKLILAKVNLWHNSFKLPAPGIGIMNEQSNEQQVSTAATPILPTIRPPPYSLFFPPSQICNFAYAFTFTLIHRRCWQTHLTRPLNEWVHHQVAAAGSQKRENGKEIAGEGGKLNMQIIFHSTSSHRITNYRAWRTWNRNICDTRFFMRSQNCFGPD